jgi:hypothetical protein
MRRVSAVIGSVILAELTDDEVKVAIRLLLMAVLERLLET